MSQIEKENEEKEESSAGEEPTKEAEEEKKINRELDESDNEQPEKMKEEEKVASQLKIKPTPEAVKQEPPPIDTATSKNKFEEDCKRWKESLIRFTQTAGATPINDEDFLVNREHYTMQRDSEFATGQHSKLYKCKKQGVDQMCKITPLNRVNLKYKNNLLKTSAVVMRYLIENQHPSIVQHLAFFQSPNKLYIFMEPLGSTNLSAFIKKNRKPNSAAYLAKVKKYGREVAEAINHLCVLGVAHMNIKTVNVCLTPDQSSVKLVGFNSSVTIYNPIKNEEILAPKHVEWHYNHAPESSKGPFKCVPADVWSFGILVVCMLTGTPPFPKKINRIDTRLKAHLHRHFVQPEQTLLNLLMKCFEKDPTKRIEIASILLHPYFN